jgi:hypothetical protein
VRDKGKDRAKKAAQGQMLGWAMKILKSSTRLEMAMLVKQEPATACREQQKQAKERAQQQQQATH